MMLAPKSAKTLGFTYEVYALPPILHYFSMMVTDNEECFMRLAARDSPDTPAPMIAIERPFCIFILIMVISVENDRNSIHDDHAVYPN